MNRYFSIAKREVKSSIVDNRRLICLMFSLYVISAVLAWIFHAQLLEILNPFLGEIKAEMSWEFTMDPALELFINNETAGLTTYFSSVFFGIMKSSKYGSFSHESDVYCFNCSSWDI